MYLLSKFD